MIIKTVDTASILANAPKGTVVQAQYKTDELIQTISDRTGMVRSEVGNKLRNQLRHIPEFAFFLDDSLDYIDRIDDLLKDN